MVRASRQLKREQPVHAHIILHVGPVRRSCREDVCLLGAIATSESTSDGSVALCRGKNSAHYCIESQSPAFESPITPRPTQGAAAPYSHFVLMCSST